MSNLCSETLLTFNFPEWSPLDFSVSSPLFPQFYIIRFYSFHPTLAFNYEFHTLLHFTIFLTACRRSKQCLFIPVGTQNKSYDKITEKSQSNRWSFLLSKQPCFSERRSWTVFRYFQAVFNISMSSTLS